LSFDIWSPLGFVIVVVVVVAVGYIIFHSVSGFEMTPQLKIETAQLEMCILYDINSTKCDQIYGGIEK